MKEYGSDFHVCGMDYRIPSNLFNNIGNFRFYACGRHAIDAIILQEGWKRIWIPAYFCYEVINHIKQLGIEIIFYDDNPLCEDDDILVRNLPYRERDVLLRMNYFGLRNRRSNKCISVPVIEDHSHDLFSNWSLNSDADWCIASVRKSLPVAAGGILWSPLGKRLPDQIESTGLCERMASIRYDAMRIKSDYLKMDGDKTAFREKYIQSERMLAQLPLSGMDKESFASLLTIDLKQWIYRRFENWNAAIDMLNRRFVILKSLDIEYWQPFSLVFLCESFEERMALRQYLIKNCIYPAILWEILDNSHFMNALDFSRRMLSIPCDARYNQEQIKKMCSIINSFYD
ncbi:hypothetical protein [Parabacteroides sp.]|uniref:hypothetical protein n=1 Tax=Parabacteroides sp. TaxID=1869337 RepID=UPI00257C2C4C|nr:hypothetical protein [Parabacteroides sp.]